MYSPDCALMVNSIGKYISTFENKLDFYNLLVAVIPKKVRKNISYVKKIKDETKSNEDSIDLVGLLSKKHEISKREVKEYLSIE
jgi:hypothetical protein